MNLWKSPGESGDAEQRLDLRVKACKFAEMA